jgi:hypothetical protein
MESPGQQDASTVLPVNKHSCLLWAIPDPLEVFPLRCVNLESEAWPACHRAGLLPATLDQKAWVLTRCAKVESVG